MVGARAGWCWLACALLVGCADGTAPAADVVAEAVADAPAEVEGDAEAEVEVAGDFGARYLYDPFGQTRVTTLPDDALAEQQLATLTGVRLRIGEDLPWFAASEGLFRGAISALDGLDGWGLNAAIAVVFDQPLGQIPSGFPESMDSPDLRLVRLDEEGPVRIPFEVQRTEDGGLLVVPMQPLKPSARHGLVGTTALKAADGRDIDPGPVLTELLEGRAEGRLAPMNTRYAELLGATGLGSEEVAFAVTFTTQSALAASRTVASDIRQRDYDWDGPRECAEDAGVAAGARHCEGGFDAWSWRDEQEVYSVSGPVSQYRLGVSAWLPAGAGPHPTVMFGHGLAHGREVARAMAKIVVPLGIAVVAIDAVGHGAHPDAPAEEGLVLFEFFGLSLSPLGLEPLRLRDNFRQSTWDKLQLLRLLELHPDLDGDAVADLDLGRLAYIGESFGGIMGIELLALTEHFQAAVLQLGGGRVTSIISDARRFAAFSLLVGDSDATESEGRRLFPVVQAAMDAGDASTWGPHVLRERLNGVGVARPHLLLQLVIDDDTIPDPSSDSLVRALGLPQVPPVVRAVPMAEVSGTAPVQANHDKGLWTVGAFQFNRIRRNMDGPVEKATHDYTPSSVEAVHQLREFMRGWVEGEVPTIVDPYADLATPQLVTP